MLHALNQLEHCQMVAVAALLSLHVKYEMLQANMVKLLHNA